FRSYLYVTTTEETFLSLSQASIMLTSRLSFVHMVIPPSSFIISPSLFLKPDFSTPSANGLRISLGLSVDSNVTTVPSDVFNEPKHLALEGCGTSAGSSAGRPSFITRSFDFG